MPLADLTQAADVPGHVCISTDRPRAELAAMGIAQLGKKEAKATPPAFRELLLSMAREAHNTELT